MNDSGQLYTIEGIAAAVLMVVTAYLVVSTTTVLTPQDVHIIDMHLEQLGSDVLAMMDTPDSYGNESMLAWTIRNNNTTVFQTTFLSYVNASTDSSSENMRYNATIYYRNSTDEINSFTFNASPYYRENAVKVSRWVYLPDFINTPYATHSPDLRNGTQTVLVEVLLWRE